MKRFAAVLTTFVFVFFLAGCDASSPVGTSNDASTSQPGDGSSTTSKSIPDDFAYETTRDVKVVLRAAQGGVAAQVLAPTYDRGDILLVDGETNENGVLRTTLPLPTAMSEVLVRTSERTVTVPVNNGRVEFNLSSKSAKRAKASRAPDKTVQGNPSCSAYADHFSGVSQDLVQAKRIEGSELSTLIGNTPHDFNTSHGTITVESVTTKNGGNEIVDMTISTDFEVRGVTAKGGPKANLWVLDPAQLLNSREYTPPTNPGGQQAAMSHLDICINPDDGDDDDDDDGDDDDGDDDDEDCDEDDGDDGDDDDDESCAPDASNDAFSTDEDQTLNVSAPGVLQNDTDPNSDNLSVTLVSGPSNGSLTLNSDGSFDYTPNANFNGQDSFTYEASDGNGGTDQATVTITVHSVNDPVSASDDAYSTDQGQTLSVNAPGVLQNDSDPDGDNLTVSQVLSNPSNGTVTLNSDGSFDYTPNGGFSGQDSFTYEVSDGNGSTAPATVTITVNNVNDAPTAQNDTYTTDEDQPLTVNAPGILQNDSDPDSDTLAATLESGPSSGSLTLNGDGSFDYTPDADFNGMDRFIYKVADGNGGMDQAVVTITVNPVNDTPTANDDTYSTPEGQTLQVGAPNGTLSNDTDPDQGDNLSASLVSGPSNGSLTFGPDGSIIYTPDTGFSGQDTFTYEASDGNGSTDQATVTITVTSSGSSLVLQCPAESDINGNTGLPNGWPPSNEIGFVGEVRIGDGGGNGPGAATFEYDLSENTSQPDDTGQFDHQDGQAVSFTLTADAQGNAEFSIGNAADNPLTHTFNLSNVEFDGLMIRGRADAGDAVRIENVQLDGSSIGQNLVVAPNPGDSSQDFLLLSGPNFANGFTLSGTFTFDWDSSVPTNSALAFQIKGYNGPDNPSDFVCGSGGGNTAPTAQDDSYTTDEDQTLTVNAPGVQQNDNDPDGDGLTSTVVSSPSNGSLMLNGDGSFTYTPDANFNGTDSFDYEISDGNGGTDQATATITVNPVNDPVSASDDAYSTPQGQTLTVTAPGVLQNDSDPDGDNLTATQVLSGPSNGTVTLNSDGSFDYTPNGGFTGQDTFTYEVSDGNGSTAPATVTITVDPGNRPPTTQDDSYTTNEDQTLTVNAPGVLQNDSDPDTDPLTATLVNGPSNGTLTLNSDGSFTYTPNANVNGPDSFTYKAVDGNGGMTQATVTITVNPVNDPVSASDDSYTATQDQTLTVNAPGVLQNDSDPDGDNLTATQVLSNPSNGTVTLNSDGSFDYTPNGGFTGQDTFTYEVSDGNGSAAPATVTITVNAAGGGNGDPTATDDAYTTSQGQTLTIGAPGVLQNDSDPESDPLTVSLVSGPNSGASLTLNSDGSFSYTPNASFTGQDSFVYEAADGNGGTNQAVVTITVNGNGGGGGNGSTVFVPGQNQTASLAYEDLWPGEGDFDMNDLVIDYNFEITQDQQGDVTEIRARFITRASGASFLNGFAIQLPTSPSSIASVSGQDLQEGVFSVGGSGVETGTNQAVVPIYDNQYNRIPRSSGSFTANTENDAPFVTPDTIDVTITFASPTSLSGTAPYNPFIVVDGERGREVHLVDREPTSKADPSFFGQSQDTSDPNTGRFYKNEDNLPWAIHIPVSFEYPKEKADIRDTHLKFAPWTESGGAVNQDWYLDKPGYRNDGNMYKRFQ